MYFNARPITATGAELVDATTVMNSAADSFNRQVSGLSDQLNGNICISVNDIVGIYLPPSAIAAFRLQQPALTLKLSLPIR